MHYLLTLDWTLFLSKLIECKKSVMLSIRVYLSKHYQVKNSKTSSGVLLVYVLDNKLLLFCSNRINFSFSRQNVIGIYYY